MHHAFSLSPLAFETRKAARVAKSFSSADFADIACFSNAVNRGFLGGSAKLLPIAIIKKAAIVSAEILFN